MRRVLSTVYPVDRSLLKLWWMTRYRSVVAESDKYPSQAASVALPARDLTGDPGTPALAVREPTNLAVFVRERFDSPFYT
jgi:hypothetical protein